MKGPNSNITSTAVPSFAIFKEGKAIDMASVIGVTVEFGFSQIPNARIIISDGSKSKQNFEHSETNWKLGEELEIKLGYAQQNKIVFKGNIIKQNIKSGSNNNSSLIVELRHDYYKSTLSRSSGVFLKEKDSEIIEDLLSKYGFKKSIEDTKFKNPQMVQHNCSDWDFVNLRAEANNMFVLPKNEVLTLQLISKSEDAKFDLIYGINIEKVELEIDNRICFEAYEANTWNAEGQKIVNEEASIVALNTLGIVKLNEVASKSKHKKNLILGIGSLNESETTQIANQNKQIGDLGRIYGTIKCQGTTEAELGDWIKLGGLGKQFNGSALITGILHECSAGVWFTTYQIGINKSAYADRYSNINDLPAAGLLPALHGLQVGIVSKIVSENNDEKILVSLPSIKENQDAIWARCARIDAGKGRGLVYRPEVNDEVILGFINNDPRQAIILGSMHSSKNTIPDDLKSDDTNMLKGFVSREKLKFIFNEDKKSIQIETPLAKIIIDDDKKSITITNESNKVEIGEKGIELTSKKDIILKAEGDIKIEGKSVKIKAKSDFAAEGASGAKVTSNGMLDLKGTMVNIN